MPQQFEFSPIGKVHSPVVEPADDIWAGVKCRIDLDSSRFTPDFLVGLADFSHVEVVFLFHRVPESEITMGSRHPRNRLDWPKVGIFAQRNKNRPNHIGLTIAQVIKREGRSLYLRGLDAVDGTPVLDIKPVMVEYLPREPINQPEWSHELMNNYWKE